MSMRFNLLSSRYKGDQQLSVKHRSLEIASHPAGARNDPVGRIASPSAHNDLRGPDCLASIAMTL